MSSAGAGPFFDAVSSYDLRLGRLRAGKCAEDADEREHFAPDRNRRSNSRVAPKVAVEIRIVLQIPQRFAFLLPRPPGYFGSRFPRALDRQSGARERSECRMPLGLDSDPHRRRCEQAGEHRRDCLGIGRTG